MGKKKSPDSQKRNLKPVLIKIGTALILIILLLYLPARSIYSSAKEAMVGVSEINSGIKVGNFDQVKGGLSKTKSAVDRINFALNFYMYLRVIPFVGGFYADAKHFAAAGSYELKAGEEIVNSLEPYKDELGLSGQTVAGQDRIAQAVKVLNKVLPNIDKYEPYLAKAKDEVRNIDVNKYPEKIGQRELKSRIDEAKNLIMGIHFAVTEAKPALEIAPEALGEPDSKTYLMLFQNDKELRATGGFLTAYAFLRLDKGHLSTTQSDDIYRLDERLLKTCLSKICPLTPPAPIVKYLPEVTGKPRSAWSMRDSNLSPDLPTSAKQFENMYQMLDDAQKFDGILTIDTNVVEELIKLTGPINVGGIEYSANVDKRCNCPNVVYELEHYAEVASKGENDRKEVVGTLMQTILTKLLGSGADKLPSFINVGVKLAGDKHIMMYMHDPKTQAALSALGWTGEINKNPQGDYLHINDSNFAGGKSNIYVEEKVTYEINIAGNGTAKNKVTIEYKNPQPYNTWLNAILRSYVRIYSPKGSQLISSKGSDDSVLSQFDDNLNKTYFEGFVQVRPQNSRILSLEYSVPYSPQDKKYNLLIQKQPGAKDHHYVIKINGSTKAEFDLISDKQLNLSF